MAFVPPPLPGGLPRPDPVPVFNFLVQLIEKNGAVRLVAGFQECSGLESTLELEEYQEGGVNDRTHKFPTRFSFSNITLKRGVSFDPQIRLWHLKLLKGEADRRDGIVILQNEIRLPVLGWRFENGLPVKYTGPTLNATQSEIAIETLEIAHERIEPFDVATAIGGLF